MTWSCLGLFRPAVYPFPNGLTWPWIFLLMGSYVPFVFPWTSSAHLHALGFLGHFPNFVFPWAFTGFIRLPWPNYFIPILRVYGSAIKPLLSLLALLWACRSPFLLFFHIIHCPWVCYSLFLFFRALLSLFAFSRSIYLFHGPVIHYSCRLDLMVFVLYLLPTSFRSVLLLGFLLFIRVPQKDPQHLASWIYGAFLRSIFE